MAVEGFYGARAAVSSSVSSSSGLSEPSSSQNDLSTTTAHSTSAPAAASAGRAAFPLTQPLTLPAVARPAAYLKSLNAGPSRRPLRTVMSSALMPFYRHACEPSSDLSDDDAGAGAPLAAAPAPVGQRKAAVSSPTRTSEHRLQCKDCDLWFGRIIGASRTLSRRSTSAAGEVSLCARALPLSSDRR